MGRKWKLTDFIFLGSKITMDGDCSHESKQHLLLGRKAMTKQDRVKKQRHNFADKAPYSQSYDLSSSHVWMWNLDHKKDSTDELMLLNCGTGELLRVSWTEKKSNQSILKEINPDFSLKKLMLKLQYFGPLIRRANSLEKTLMLGKGESRRRRGDRGWDG